METYREVAHACRLTGITKNMFLRYMMARWASEEKTQCQTGYAQEWGFRFSSGNEYGASDSVGQSILRDLASSYYPATTYNEEE
jgi:hypothetical protein